jgi:hypothetical protein
MPEAPIPLSPALSDSAALIQRQLPSGRSLALRASLSGEEIEIRSPQGELDLRITLTDAGPVVSLRAARLELDAPAVAVRCQTFAVSASSEVSLSSGGALNLTADELRAKTEHDIHLNGAYVRLNCDADAVVDVSSLIAPTDSAAPGCEHCDHAAQPHEP